MRRIPYEYSVKMSPLADHLDVAVTSRTCAQLCPVNSLHCQMVWGVFDTVLFGTEKGDVDQRALRTDSIRRLASSLYGDGMLLKNCCYTAYPPRA